MSIDAMKLALEALEEIADEVLSPYDNKLGDAILALRAATEQAQDPETELETYKRLYELRGKALERPCSNCGHQPAKIKATAQTGSAQSGLAEKVPAKGTLLEQTLKDVWDEMPHTALMDAIIGGTGVMLGDKRIDPASIYKQPEQEPVFELGFGWIDDATKYPRGTKLYATPPRQWQGLTDQEIWSDGSTMDLSEDGIRKFARAIEAKLKEKNT